MKQFQLDDKKYRLFCELIRGRTGIQVGEGRREVLTHALEEMTESMKCTSLDQLFACLQDGLTDSEAWNDLIKEVTIGETYFFRDSEYIKALYRNILPDLIARHQTDQTLRVWSAGCATGEEPYSLAIMLRQILSDIDQWKILILATDINRQAIKHAATGRYRSWSFRETDPVIRSIYFTFSGNAYTIGPAIRKMASFAYHNLAEDNYPSPANQTNNLDLILCQNVAIYLPMSLIHDMINRFYQCLSDGGWLMVGPSESYFEFYKQFQTFNFHGVTAYQRVSDTPLSSSVQTDVLAPHHIPSVKILQLAPFDKRWRASSRSPHADVGVIAPTKDEASERKYEADPDHHSPTPPSQKGVDADEWDDLCHRGEEFMRQHRYDEARQCFLSCLSSKDSSITAQYRMARLEANAGRLNEARKWAEQALHRDPFRSEVHYTLALVHQVQGEFQEAINQLKKVIYLDPNFILAHFGLFHLYQRTGSPIESERHRVLAVHLASKLSPDTVLSGSDDLTAGQLLAMAQASPANRMRALRGKS
jgi:chemotaxis protein methyltransferase CheR